MKNIKLIFALTMALGLTFTSCKKDDEEKPDQRPSISFKGGNNYISEDATVTAGETFTIGINANSNTDSDSKLISVKYTITSNNAIVHEFDSVFKENSYSLDYNFTMNNAGEAKIKFVVTDKVGEKAEISLTIISEESTTDLGTSTDVFWERIGGNAATGLTEFGLKWENNLKETHAVIEKDGASKLVQLTAAEWSSITTVEALQAAIEAGTDLDDYRGISTTTPGNYEEVIATEFNGEYFIINLSNATIETGTNGTTVKIFGQSKK